MTPPPHKPHGIRQLKATFGDPTAFVNSKWEWEQAYLTCRELITFDLIYAYDPRRRITRITAHQKIVEHLISTLNECIAAGVPLNRMKYGGCYSWRAMRRSPRLSTHTWGIAIDLEPAENPQGRPWKDDGKMLDPRIIKIFKKEGWKWGNDFLNNPDPMHFQWVTGY